MKKNKTIFLNKFQTIKKWEEMNLVFVDLEKNLNVAVAHYKKIETKNIEMNIITKAKIVFLFC